MHYLIDDMNGHQFKELVSSKYGVESLFWAPEAATAAFRRTTAYREGDSYQIAMLVLCENETAFAKRLQGTISDGWLSAKTFGPICQQMIAVMEDVAALCGMSNDQPNTLREPNEYLMRLALTDWQAELLALLKTFS